MDDIRNEGGNIVRTIDVDLDNPEQTFLFPKTYRFRRWYRGVETDSLELRLEFSQGLYVLAELSFDDSDLGVFNIDYIDRLIELDKNRKSIDWSSPAALIDRRSLLPVPDEMLDYFRREVDEIDFELSAAVDSFVSFLEEQRSLTLYINDSYGLKSLSGDSEEEFRRLCREYANPEKSERALELVAVFETKIQQAIGRLQSFSQPALDAEQEIGVAHTENFFLACESLLGKAINLLFLDQQGENEVRIKADADRFTEALRRETDEIAAGLECFGEEFERFASELIEEFGALESEFEVKLGNITAIEAPLSKSTIQILRVAQVWLPYWRAEYSTKIEEYNSVLIQAY